MDRRALPLREQCQRAVRPFPRGTIAVAGSLVVLLLLLLAARSVNLQPLDVISPLTPFARLYDLTALVSVLLLAHALGSFMLERLALTIDGIEQAAIACALGLGTVAYFFLALGLVGLYRPVVLLAVIAGLIIALRHRLYRATAAIARTPQHLRTVRVDRLVATLLPLIGGGVCLSLLGALTPPHHHDPLAYHLPLPQRFLETGVVEPVDDIIGSDLPLTVELLFGLGLVWGSEPFAALLHFAFGGLTAAIAWGVTQRWFDRVTAWLALVVFLGTPLVLVWARVANNDLAVGCFLLAALAVATHPQSSTSEGHSPRALLLVGAFAGLAFSTKYQAAPALIPLGLWLALAAWRAGSGPRLSRQRLWAGCRAPLIVGGVAALVAAPWILRNIDLLIGLAKFLLNSALATTMTAGAPTAGVSSAFGLTISPRTPLGYLLLPIRSYIRGDFEQRYVILNPLFLLLPTLAVMPLLWRHRALQVALAMAGAYSVIWALGVQELRYLLAICPFFAIGTAALLRRAWDRRPLRPLVGGGLLVAATVTLVLVFLHVGGDRPIAVTLGRESRDQYLRQSAAFGATYRSTSFLLDQLADGERALFVNEVQTFYLPEGKVAPTSRARNVIDDFARRYATPQEALAALRVQGITYLLVNDADLRWWAQGGDSGNISPSQQAFTRLTDQLTVVYREGPADRPNITVYRVP